MTSAADSAATLAPQAECEVAPDVVPDASPDTSGAQRAGNGDELGVSAHLPIFSAFDDLGLTGRDIAELVGVTPPTVSKWRSAKVRMQGDKLAFLTLVLAHLLDEADKVLNVRDRVDQVDHAVRGAVEAAHAALAYQDVLNRDLAAHDVRAGAQRFRVWWSSGEALKWQEKRIQPLSSTAVLDVLKKMRITR